MHKLAIALTATLLATSASADINSTTNREYRTNNMCDIAINPQSRPEFTHWMNEKLSLAHYTFIDLNDDGVYEFIGGSWKGPREIRNPYPYFMVKDDDYPVHGNSFIMARNWLVNDYNGDHVQDVFVVQHGPDHYPPEEQPNKYILSEEDGHRTFTLHTRSTWHGGASGDIDGDGDADVLASPGPNNEIVLFENQGNGHFTERVLFRRVGRNYTVSLWDVDQDGYLDVLYDGHEEDLMIRWGKSRGRFSRAQKVMDTSNSLVQDLEFADITGDGVPEIVWVSSVQQHSGSHYYGGWNMGYLEVVNRKFINTDIDEYRDAENKNSWIPFITACDVTGNGKLDIVHERIGLIKDLAGRCNPDFCGAKRIIWTQELNGNFVQKRLTN